MIKSSLFHEKRVEEKVCILACRFLDRNGNKTHELGHPEENLFKETLGAYEQYAHS